MKKVIHIIPALLILFPKIASANVLYLDCYSQNNCGLCDFLYLLGKLSKYILTLAGSASLLFFVIGGLILLTSQGVSGRILNGRKMIFTSLIGVAIVYFAWVGVNFVIYSLTGGGNSTQGVATVFSTSWNEVQCIKTPDSQLLKEAPKPIVSGAGCKSTWESGTEPSCGGVCVGFTTSGIRSQQCLDASPALVSMLSCMDSELRNNSSNYPGLTKSDIIITSISDDNGLKQCRDSYISACFHTYNSCHYGHGYSDGSYAVDFRSRSLSTTQANSLERLANRCNGHFINETYILDSSGSRRLPTSSPHYHVSAQECTGN